MKHSKYLLPIQTVHRLLQEIGFQTGANPSRILVLKLIRVLKPSPGDNVSPWDSTVEKEHPV
jgi:hypothetical protein